MNIHFYKKYFTSRINTEKSLCTSSCQIHPTKKRLLINNQPWAFIWSIYLCWTDRPQACDYIKKETLAQVFSCEFCAIFKSTFFTEHLWTTASEPKLTLVSLFEGFYLVRTFSLTSINTPDILTTGSRQIYIQTNNWSESLAKVRAKYTECVQSSQYQDKCKINSEPK